MIKEKIEIKIQSKSEYYFDLIKKYVFTIFKSIFSILILAGTLYISFYMLLFLIIIIIITYLFNRLKKTK